MVLRSYLESKLSVDDPESNSVSVQGNDKYLSASVSLEKPAAIRELNAVCLDCKLKLFYCVISTACSHGDGHRALCKDGMFKTCIFQMSLTSCAGSTRLGLCLTLR